MAKTNINTNPVANGYAGPNERIVEFFDRDLQAGGLIAFRRTRDGKLTVDLYNLDAKVNVNVSTERG